MGVNGKQSDGTVDKLHAAKKTAEKKAVIAQKQELQTKAFEKEKRKANKMLWRNAKDAQEKAEETTAWYRMVNPNGGTKAASLESEVKNANIFLWKKAKQAEEKKKKKDEKEAMANTKVAPDEEKPQVAAEKQETTIADVQVARHEEKT